MSAIEGIDGLRALIGKEAGVSEWIPVTQDMIQTFADLTGDHQWIHLDIERARAESPFRTTIAHGFLTVSLLSQMMQQAVDVRGDFKMRINYGFNKLRFPTPVPAGSRVRAHISVNSVKDVDGGVEVVWGITVELENHAKPALAAEWVTRIYFN